MKKHVLFFLFCAVVISVKAQRLSHTRVKMIMYYDTVIYRLDKFGTDANREVRRIIAKAKKKKLTPDSAVRELTNILIKYTANGPKEATDLSVLIDSMITREKGTRKIISKVEMDIRYKHMYANVYYLIGQLRLLDATQPIDSIKAYVDKIRYHETASQLYRLMRDTIEKFKYSDSVYYSGLKENISVVRVRVNTLTEEDYPAYGFTETAKKIVKGINMNMDNDFFAIAPKAAGIPNLDRDYTGGARIEVLTDFLKMRLLPVGNIHLSKNDLWWFSGSNYLSYQGLFFGSEAYTPYIRDTLLFNKDTVVDSLDRPFASYQYWGWVKYRQHRRGIFRDMFQIKVGKVGGDRGQIVQAIVHRDLSVDSPTPRGWGAQIASGGRVGLNVEYYPEAMLLSNDGDAFNVLRGRKSKVPDWVNISGMIEARIGHDMTSWGVGFEWCNLSFKERSWNNHILRSDRKSTHCKYSVSEFFKNDCIVAVKAKYRYERHNSMLEGFGIWWQLPDNDPLSPKDIYVVQEKDMVRYIGQFEYLFGFKTQFANIYYKGVFLTPETRLPKASRWQYWGSIGVSFLLP